MLKMLGGKMELWHFLMFPLKQIRSSALKTTHKLATFIMDVKCLVVTKPEVGGRIREGFGPNTPQKINNTSNSKTCLRLPR